MGEHGNREDIHMIKRILIASAAGALCTTAAIAGGIDRSNQFVAPIFEETGETGGYAQLSFGRVDPEANRNGGGQTDPLGSYISFGFAAKKDLSDKLSLTLIHDEPFGVAVAYVDDPVGSPAAFAGGRASVDSSAFTGIARYEMDENISFHGGIRLQKMSGEIVGSPGGASTFLRAESDFAVGYLVGAAYERPDIALRVALTYNSAIDNEMAGIEIPLAGGVPAGAPVATAFTVETPASLNLEFQTGIAADTLLFGSIRYAEWDGFNVTTSTGTYASFSGDTTTYSVGVGRRLSEALSLAVSLGYEAAGGETTTPLAPTTGTKSISLAGTYNLGGGAKLSGGVSYVIPGDQTLAGTGGLIGWSDNSAIGVGFRLSKSF